MSLIVDGYNVILTAGLIEGQRPGKEDPAALNRSRFRLIDLVARHKPRNEVAVVVFDAKNPPSGVPSTFSHHGVTVMFAVDYDEADDLIEHLIRIHSAPKQLKVISSDHRLQAAATRRKASFLDVDQWLDEIEDASEALRQKRKRKKEQEPRGTKSGDLFTQPGSKTPEAIQSDEEGADQTDSEGADVEQWLEFLQVDDADELLDKLENNESNETALDAHESSDRESGDLPVTETIEDLFGTEFDAAEFEEMSDVFSKDFLSEIQSELDRDEL